jgi:hypothetical protein
LRSARVIGKRIASYDESGLAPYIRCTSPRRGSDT